MKVAKMVIIASLGLICTRLAHAEYGCQSGFVPVYQGNRQVCVADYNLPVWQQHGQQQQQPAEVWEDRYGAIAKSENKKDTYAFSVGAKTVRAAKQEALARCGKKCRIVDTFVNSCVGASWGTGRILFRGGNTREEAESASLKACQIETGGVCQVSYSDCSLAVRVQ